MPAPNHILRELVDIRCHGRFDGLAIRRQMEHLCTEPLTRAIDALLTSFEIPDDQLISIDRLQVDISNLSSRDLEGDLVTTIVSALRQELATRIGEPGQIRSGQLRPLHRSTLRELLYFLQRGHLPWSADGDATWRAAVVESLSTLAATDRRILVEILKQTEARQRLASHFPELTLRHVLRLLRTEPDWQEVLTDVESLLVELHASPQLVEIRERWLRILLDAVILPEHAGIDAICRLLVKELHTREKAISLPPRLFDLRSSTMRRALAGGIHSIDTESAQDVTTDPASRSVETPDESRQKAEEASVGAAGEKTLDETPEQDAEPVYIRNAGLVILAPYLPAFFRRLGLVEEERLREIPTVLHLMHYLVFGLEACWEWDLALNKILCGLPLQYAIETPPPLSPEQKEEADHLLEAVVANWPALKNTSPAGLRSTFLQREGALRQQDASWHLVLTRTSFDVLLDQLPWTISMIKLPWMPWLLQTDWAD